MAILSRLTGPVRWYVYQNGKNMSGALTNLDAAERIAEAGLQLIKQSGHR